MGSQAAVARLRVARGADDVAHIRRLFLAYGESLGFSLCFQNFDDELAGLPGKYAPPRGELWLAFAGDDDAVPVGCVGVRPFDDTTAEMKRLYVAPAGRGLGLGRRLAEAATGFARDGGYQRIVLDTISRTMGTAERIYRTLGYAPCQPYYHNPVEGAVYYECAFTRAGLAPDANA